MRIHSYTSAILANMTENLYQYGCTCTPERIPIDYFSYFFGRLNLVHGCIFGDLLIAAFHVDGASATEAV